MALDVLDRAAETEEAPTARQREVLDAALALLVDPKRQLTMAAVADRASCSKETLYKWFGGRDGLLTATVQWQAAKVRPVAVPPEGFDRESLRVSLEHFARDWLATLGGRTSVALNRLAIGEAGDEGRDLGRIVLENGPLAMRRRLAPVLHAGKAGGLIVFASEEEAFSTFFGLVVRDVQIRLLLGDPEPAATEAIDRDAARAAGQFLALYGAKQTSPAGVTAG
ncbi:TetR family transcriptional regulator [Aureimonas endophytica]|uniref:TetR family transcriptional regulator n=1 Tax=Aureimonas endophytica TaxID=2027858 RepID=A0A916ZFG6_9HYPH|nr:TetR/AcrR family transcriptional regulator C-terminal domain-containing protein [Aureimonas endophytica]GGD91880.1 TetR family transcriptional regulator [Aureimonas endophytica]